MGFKYKGCVNTHSFSHHNKTDWFRLKRVFPLAPCFKKNIKG